MRSRTWYYWEFAAVSMLMAGINFFPISVSTWIARRIGGLMFLLLPKRRKLALQNLNIAFRDSKSSGERKKIARESFRHLATCIMEFFRLAKSVEQLKQHVSFSGTESLERAFARGKGVVLVMSHLGPWEYLGFLTYVKKYPTTVLGRPIRNPYFNRWVKSLRRSVNLDYADKTLGPRKLLSYLNQNRLVAITIDQWAGNEGLWIDFFKLPTSTISLPARLAEKTGCALIPAYCIRTGSGRYQIQILPEVAVDSDADNWVERVTRKLNQLLEEQIRLFPEQWVWTHKRWKAGKILEG
ncbi:MAG: lysophospholipid acyltransferase family protein [Candidatus Omnitrophica bacterium]|nr:lysophospholipid acyltransferase family protein [Candidatus Omnitrophota bacterium]